MFSTGITAFAPDWAKGFHDDTKYAAYNANRGFLSDAPGIWTVDKAGTQEVSECSREVGLHPAAHCGRPLRAPREAPKAQPSGRASSGSHPQIVWISV